MHLHKFTRFNFNLMTFPVVSGLLFTHITFNLTTAFNYFNFFSAKFIFICHNFMMDGSVRMNQSGSKFKAFCCCSNEQNTTYC